MRWIISILALWLVVSTTAAKADIVRSCSGTLVPGAPAIASINGEGTYKNTKANECREHARQAIVACATALFDGTVLPAACKCEKGGAPVEPDHNQRDPGQQPRRPSAVERMLQRSRCQYSRESDG
jgi:hypothetical protein